jgi:hypothetical protein
MVDTYIRAKENVFDLLAAAGPQNIEQKEDKRIGYSLLKPQVAEFLRLVHITSEKRQPHLTEIGQLQKEMRELIEFETARLDKVRNGS